MMLDKKRNLCFCSAWWIQEHEKTTFVMYLLWSVKHQWHRARGNSRPWRSQGAVHVAKASKVVRTSIQFARCHNLRLSSFAMLLPVTVMGHDIWINLALSSLFFFEHHSILFCETIIQLSIYIYTKRQRAHQINFEDNNSITQTLQIHADTTF